MFCPHCGNEYEEGAVFCENCGMNVAEEGEGVSAELKRLEREQERALPAQTTPMPSTSNQGAGNAARQKSRLPFVIAIIALCAAIAAIVLVFVLGSPDDSKPSDPVEHQIVFETFGGSQYKDAKFKTGTIIEMPTAPVRTRSTFEGWYADASCAKPVTFPYTITADDPETLTFYAKWSDGVAASTVSPSSPTTTTPGTMDYMSDATAVLPLSSTTYLTESDLYYLNADQLQRAINEIYARNGYIFQQSITEKQYFESRPWYQGNEYNQDVVKARFNQFENANIKLLQSYRDTHF